MDMLVLKYNNKPKNKEGVHIFIELQCLIRANKI